MSENLLPLQDSNAIFQKYHPLKSAGWFSFVRVYRDGSAQYGTCYHNGTTAYFARVHAHDLDEIAGHLREAAAAMRGRAGEPQDAADVRAVLRRWRRAVDEAQIGLLPGQFERDVARTFRMLDEIEAALGNPEQSEGPAPTEDFKPAFMRWAQSLPEEPVPISVAFKAGWEARGRTVQAQDDACRCDTADCDHSDLGTCKACGCSTPNEPNRLAGSLCDRHRSAVNSCENCR